jgi:hypothetical protein
MAHTANMFFCRCHGLQGSYDAVWHWQFGPLMSQNLSSGGERLEKIPALDVTRRVEWDRSR